MLMQGGRSTSGSFLFGHEQTLRIALEKPVGGVFPMRTFGDAAKRYVAGELQRTPTDFRAIAVCHPKQLALPAAADFAPG